MPAVHHLSVDIETYSDVDIGKAGLFRYAQSPAFSILLFAYAVDGGPSHVIDLTREKIPDTVARALFDPNTLKHAYNAAFEWYCLSRHFKLHERPEFPPEAWLPQWRCTMLHGLYCGYPAGLDAAGKALGLPQDKQKLSTGKALIRYFCVPCKPTKSNGNRTRNLPCHDADKWDKFKKYCVRDVEVERAIAQKLKNYPLSSSEHDLYVLDQKINDRGVLVDLQLANEAI